MKALTAFSVLASLGFFFNASAGFALSRSFEQHYRCSAQTGANETTSFRLDLVNHPDIEIAHYDSSEMPDNTINGSITSQLLVDKVETKGHVHGKSETVGKHTSITQTLKDGRVCIVGEYYHVIFGADVTVSNVKKDVNFACTNTTLLPEGAIQCE